MARKGENIFKRKDGRWEARYIKGYELSGKARYGFCYGKTYKEAKAKVTHCRAALLGGAPLPAANGHRRFSFFCQEWLQAERGQVRESTYVKYEAVLRRHILPRLGEYAPAAVNTRLAEQFKQELLEEGLCTKTVRDILAVLHSVLKYAARQHPGAFPPVEIAYPRAPRRQPRVLTPEEQRRFVAYLMTDTDACKFGILLAMLTGLRIGELCALQWANVSLQERTLRVSATMQRLKDLDTAAGSKTKIVISSPKSDTSVRTIPLTDSAVCLCRQFDPHRPSAFLLTGTDHFMEPRQAQKRLADYTRECGLAGVHCHTLRHTFATRCAEAGFEIKSLSEILGHADTSVTLGAYVHPSMESKRDNMNKLSVPGLQGTAVMRCSRTADRQRPPRG